MVSAGRPEETPEPSPRRGRLDAALELGDRWSARALSFARAALLGPVLFGALAGGGAWALRNPGLLSELAINRPSERAVTDGLLHALVVATAFVLLAVALVRGTAPRERPGALVEAMSRLRRLFAPFLALPFVAYLRVAGIERDRPVLALCFVALSASLCAVGAYTFGAAPPDDASTTTVAPRSTRILGAGAVAFVVLLWAAYAQFFSHLSILNHHALHTRAADLGYYDNIFYQTIHGRLLGCSYLRGGVHGSAHFDPILVLLSPLYLLHPRAELLLVLQSVWLGGGALPVFLVARKRLESAGAGLVFAAAYLLYPALHGANLYEFHSLALIGPLLLWALFLLEIGAVRGYFALVFLTLLCREDVPLLVVFVGLAGLADGRAGRARIGWLTIAASVGYWLIVKGALTPSGTFFNGGPRSYGYSSYYQELIPNNRGLADVVASLFTNPAFVLASALTPAKVLFALLLLLPLGFLPLVARPGRLMLVFGALYCLLASEPAVSSIHFYYATVFFPLAFALAPEGLRQLVARPFVAQLGLEPARLTRALLAACLVASALVSWKFGAIVDNRSFVGAAGPIARRLTDDERATYAWIEAAAGAIPPDASLAVTNRTGPHASNRRSVAMYTPDSRAGYLLLDEDVLTPAARADHEARVARGELEELTRHGSLVLFRRR